jgi:HNH endonuclease
MATLSLPIVPVPVEYRDLATIGFPGYRVGSDGSVWSRRRRGPGRGFKTEWHRLRPGRKADGYLHVHLCPSSRSVWLIHRIVLQAFVGPCPEGMEARHLDGNPANNRLENLRWDTKAENMADRDRHGRTMRGSRNGHATLDEAAVRSIRAEYAAGGTTYQMLGTKYGVTLQAIYLIIRRKNWAHLQ